MSYVGIRHTLLKEPQREKGGKLAVERFEYQAAWGLSRILQLYKSGADFGIAFEFHDDVLELDNMQSPMKVIFFQVKTQKTGTWTLAKISAPSGGNGDKTREKSSESPKGSNLSYAGKMYDNYKRFPNHTDRLVFVTNQMCSGLEAGHDETKFDTAAAAKIEAFRERLKEQDPDFKAEHSKLFHFCCSTMNLASFSETIMGAVQKFVIEQTGMTETSTYAFALMLLEECRQRERINVDFTSFATMSDSFVTRKLIDDRLDEFKKKRHEAVEWTEIAPHIANSLRRRDIGAAWKLYAIDRRSRYGPGPQRFRKAVREVATTHISGARDLLTEIDAALHDVRKLAALWDATVSDDYLRAVILYEFHDV